MRATQRTDYARLSAALLLCLCFGSIHAYGVLMAPIELWLGTSRTVASLAYSVAIVSLTMGVFLSGVLGAVFSVRQRILGACVLSAAGLVMLAFNPGVFALLAGYGVLFGVSNGVAYSLAIELAAEAMSGRPARGIGLATAAYGTGAMLSARLLSEAISQASLENVILCLAASIAVCCIAAAALCRRNAPAEPVPATALPGMFWNRIVYLWTYYVLVALSGLMIIAHAPAIMLQNSKDGAAVELVAILVSGGSIVGGYFGGVIVGRWPGVPVLAGPALFQGLALVFLALPNTPAASLLLLTLMGLSYGAIIAVIPGYIRVLYGTSQFARIYGVVFTAWGLAGFSGPLLAGILYDANGDYTAALMAAAALSVIGCIVSVLPSGKWAKPER